MKIFGILLFIIIVPQSIKDIFQIYSKDELIIYGIDYVSRILEISIVLLVPLLRVRAIAAISRPQQISDLVIGPILTAGAILALGYVLTAPLNRVFEETNFFSYPKIESSWLYIFDLTIGLALADIPHMPSKFVEFVPLSHRQGNCIPYAAIRWHDFGNRPALGRPLGHFSRHPDTPLLSLSPRRRFPRPTPERVFVADHQSSSGFSGTGPSAPPPQPIGT